MAGWDGMGSMGWDGIGKGDVKGTRFGSNGLMTWFLEETLFLAVLYCLVLPCWKGQEGGKEKYMDVHDFQRLGWTARRK